MRRPNWISGLVWLAVGSAAAFLPASGPFASDALQSPGWRMGRLTVTATGQESSSATYRSSLTLGQQSTVGAGSACNLGYTTSHGLWSAGGALPVPIQLRLDRPAQQPGALQLQWSGTATAFRVYRSSDPTSVATPATLRLQVAACDAVDKLSATPLDFYLVLPDSGGAPLGDR